MNSNSLNVDKVIEKLLSVKDAKPGKKINLLETEIEALIRAAREILIAQPILLELEAPIKICGNLHFSIIYSKYFKVIFMDNSQIF